MLKGHGGREDQNGPLTVLTAVVLEDQNGPVQVLTPSVLWGQLYTWYRKLPIIITCFV